MNFKYEIQRINIFLAISVSALCLLVDFAVWCSVGSPFYALKLVSVSIPVLPLWIFGLLDYISFAALGFALGVALGGNCYVNEVSKYRGAFYFVIGITLAYLHHLFFFKALSFFVALIIALLQCLCLFLSAVNFFRVSGIAFILNVIGGIWCLYTLILSFMSFFFI